MPATAEQIAGWDISVGPDGAGLPPGSGTAAGGKTVYEAKCLACHGVEGASGQPNDRLVGGQGTLREAAPIRTIGSYWPYATTVFDYIRRAMPYVTPHSLTADETYAVTAYLLALNGVIQARRRHECDDAAESRDAEQARASTRHIASRADAKRRHPIRGYLLAAGAPRGIGNRSATLINVVVGAHARVGSV